MTSEGAEIGFTKLYYEGKEGGNNFIVIDLLGPNLKTLLDLCGGTFSLKTSLLLMFQVVIYFIYSAIKTIIHPFKRVYLLWY